MTEEQKAKIAASMKGKHAGEKNPFYGKTHSPETIARYLSSRPDRHGANHPMYGKHHTQETRDKISASNMGKQSPRKGNPLCEEHRLNILKGALRGPNHPFYGRVGESYINFGKPGPNAGKHFSIEWREHLSKSVSGENGAMFGRFGPNHPKYGVKMSEESKQKLSKMRIGVLNPQYGRAPSPRSGSGRGSWFIRESGDRVWLRSTYEVRVATALTRIGVVWEYEPRSFDLDGLHPYHPDFLINDRLWWEVKGWMRPEARDKLQQFFKQYPDESLKIIREPDIDDLEYLIEGGIPFDISAIGNCDVEG